jgi:N-acetylglutamate synthase/N-acetylornithine aminotransferase
MAHATDDLDAETNAAAASELVHEGFMRLQVDLGLTWADAAHALVTYGIDAVHINSGADGVRGELEAMAAEVAEALAELAAEDAERAARVAH